jgi:hypothetical protein
MTMVWGWILKRLANGSQGSGLWGYLTVRAQIKGRVELEEARAKGTEVLIAHLRDGAVAVFRESTPDGSREIWMQHPPQSSLFVLPVGPHEPIRQPSEPPELPQPPKALNQGNEPGPLDDPANLPVPPDFHVQLSGSAWAKPGYGRRGRLDPDQRAASPKRRHGIGPVPMTTLRRGDDGVGRVICHCLPAKSVFGGQ